MKPLKEKIEEFIPLGETKTVTSLMRRYKVSRAEIEDVVEESECLDLIVGVRTYTGIGSFKRTEYQVEKFDEV